MKSSFQCRRAPRAATLGYQQDSRRSYVSRAQRFITRQSPSTDFVSEGGSSRPTNTSTPIKHIYRKMQRKLKKGMHCLVYDTGVFRCCFSLHTSKPRRAHKHTYSAEPLCLQRRRTTPILETIMFVVLAACYLACAASAKTTIWHQVPRVHPYCSTRRPRSA